MSYLESRVRTVPTGAAKLLYLHWPLVVLVSAAAAVGLLMLYSVAGGSWEPWAGTQAERFGIGLLVMLMAALIPIWFWRNISLLAYLGALALLVAVELVGTTGGGAQRWILIGSFRLQPSELMKIALVMILAAYYDWLDPRRVSHPVWVAVPIVIVLAPVYLVFEQPDLGTSLLLLMGGGIVMFLAGVSWWYFGAVIGAGGGAIYAVLASKGTDWQLLDDYQYRRIEVFLDPTKDPLGDGYNITQAQIALGSGGWSGKGFMQGTQSRLNFLPEKHTDFIFTTLAEEFGYLGTASLLALYAGIVFFCVTTGLRTQDRFAQLLCLGIGAAFFLYFAVNMGMILGLAPVVGVPLPLVSYGGTVMIVLLGAFGLVQSAHVHRPR